MTLSNQSAGRPDREARSWIIRTAVRSTVSACIVFALALALLLALPQAKAVPVVDDAFDFALGPNNFTTQPVGKLGQLPPSKGGKQWTHGGGQWSVNWSPVSGPVVATGNYLTSPLINVSGSAGQLPNTAVDEFRISLAHKFNFPFPGSVPPAAGQLAYSINGGPFVGLPVSAFSTGSLSAGPPPFGASPLGPYVGQTTLVAPTFVPPVGSYSDLFPLINGGASFTGVTPGYSDTGGTWVPSVAMVTLGAATFIDSFQIRLINANLGSSCTADAGWDVRYLQVDFAAPEPGSLVLAAFGIASTVGWQLAKKSRGGRQTREEHGLPQPRDDLKDREAATFAAPESVLQ
ncbi:hypothetical protein EBR56_02880 [bacterium]|nr:hypothetical protein [bacterium]